MSGDVSKTLFCLAKLHARTDNHGEAARLFKECYCMRRKRGQSYPSFMGDLKNLYVMVNQARFTDGYVDLESFIP